MIQRKEMRVMRGEASGYRAVKTDASSRKLASVLLIIEMVELVNLGNNRLEILARCAARIHLL